jgi:integrase
MSSRIGPSTSIGSTRELETQGKRAGRCATAGVTCREHGCSPDRHGGLAPKTIRNVHGMLHRALQEAAERGHVPRNVASLAHPPTAKQARSHNTRDKSWDATTLARFLAHVHNDRLHAAWRLAGTTGARRGEILGLRWSDVVLDAATRTVALDDQTITVLADHGRQRHDGRQLVGPAWIGDAHGPLAFTDALVRPLRPDGFYRTFVRLAREIGAPPLNVHCLRHTYATAAQMRARAHQGRLTTHRPR